MHVLGALVRSQAAECSFSRARARKKKSRPITTIHQGATEEPPGSRQGDFREHTFGSNGPMDAQERVEGTKRTARDMGRGMMTGSHTPWAQERWCQLWTHMSRNGLYFDEYFLNLSFPKAHMLHLHACGRFFSGCACGAYAGTLKLSNPAQPNPIQPNPTQPNPIQPSPIQSNPGHVRTHVRTHTCTHACMNAYTRRHTYMT